MQMPEAIDIQFVEAVSALSSAPGGDRLRPVREGSLLTGERCLELFDAQLASRHLDLAARWLRSQGKGFYTIASAGHELHLITGSRMSMNHGPDVAGSQTGVGEIPRQRNEIKLGDHLFHLRRPPSRGHLLLRGTGRTQRLGRGITCRLEAGAGHLGRVRLPPRPGPPGRTPTMQHCVARP